MTALNVRWQCRRCDGIATARWLCRPTVAGFVLSHLDGAGRGLSELVRITKPGGTVLATAFPAGSGAPSHPAKVAVDDVLSGYGYRAPDWYLALKSAGEEQVGSRTALAELAAGVGLAGVTIDRLEVDICHLGVDALVGWRLGMAQVAPWLHDEPAERREQIRSAAAPPWRGFSDSADDARAQRQSIAIKRQSISKGAGWAILGSNQ